MKLTLGVGVQPLDCAKAAASAQAFTAGLSLSTLKPSSSLQWVLS